MGGRPPSDGDARYDDDAGDDLGLFHNKPPVGWTSKRRLAVVYTALKDRKLQATLSIPIPSVGSDRLQGGVGHSDKTPL